MTKERKGAHFARALGSGPYLGRAQAERPPYDLPRVSTRRSRHGPSLLRCCSFLVPFFTSAASAFALYIFLSLSRQSQRVFYSSDKDTKKARYFFGRTKKATPKKQQGVSTLLFLSFFLVLFFFARSPPPSSSSARPQDPASSAPPRAVNLDGGGGGLVMEIITTTTAPKLPSGCV